MCVKRPLLLGSLHDKLFMEFVRQSQGYSSHDRSIPQYCGGVNLTREQNSGTMTP